MKKLFILGIATVLFLTGCSVNFSGLTFESKHQAETYEEFKEIEKEIEDDYTAVERIESMDLNDVDSIKVATVFENIEVIYENRDDVEIQYFAFISDKTINKEPKYNVSTKNNFVFEVEWHKLVGSSYGMMRIFLPNDFKEDFTLESISGNIVGDEIISKDLDLDSISGNVTIDRIQANDIDIETISGNVKSNEIIGKSLVLFSTSGNISVDGLDVDDIKADVISGNVKLNIKSLNDDINIDSVSGDIMFTFDEEPNAEIDFASVSGDVDCVYSLDDVEIKKDSSLKATLGKGKHKIEVDTVSGDIEIK